MQQSNFILHFTGHVIIYPCEDLSQTTLVKEASGGLVRFETFQQIKIFFCKLNGELT